MSSKKIREILENPVWPVGLEMRKIYKRLHDDHDGTHEGHLQVVFSEDGDAWVSIPDAHPGHGLRFRSYAGGGSSLRVRAALLILAEAIRLDNEEPIR